MKIVILAGGQGTRFWPLSRAERPKQFLPITGDTSLLQETVDRLLTRFEKQEIYIATGRRYEPLVRSQLPWLQPRQLIIEPAARNTAPCIGLAAMRVMEDWPGETMAVLPADHVIRDKAGFLEALHFADSIAREGWLVTFGIRPTFPSTGFGYLERGELIRNSESLKSYRVRRFTEKPRLETAESFVDSGQYYWNSGMFVWTPETILAAIERHMPALAKSLREVNRQGPESPGGSAVFESIEKVSIDFGVMEKVDDVALVEVEVGWNDVGSWKAVADVRPPDNHGIVSNTRAVSIGSKDCIVHSSSGKLVALVGLENVVVVETPDAILVCEADRSQDVREVIRQLKERGWEEFL